ncbi:MAG: DMT family transporter [Clostridium sp.]|jgi:transporter family-2 protein|uniref:DMT family transporter n=1 Tax=Paraclostridium bifermentans TaxID=1490 RepID=UPI0011DD2BF6|nr:DMT family transporter [Paraclostridium bifermentans]MBQ8997973.1 DMT family transporter [Clostridium sp.]
MYNILALLIGALISIMVSFNSGLEGYVGSTYSVVIIHAIGLIAILIVAAIKKEKIVIKEAIPFYLFLGGIFGVMLTLVNVITIGSIGVALTTALAVFGQLVFSSLVDHFGLFGLTKYEFNPKKLVGLLIVFVGLVIMTMA